MSTIILIFYTSLFLLGLFRIKFMCYALPVFTFCFPESMSLLAVGQFKLSMLFIILAFIKVRIMSKNKVRFFSNQRYWQNNVVLFFIFIPFYTLFLSLITAPSYLQSAFSDIVLWTLLLMVIFIYFSLCLDMDLKIHVINGICFALLCESIVSIGLLLDFSTFQYFYDGKIELIADMWRASGTFKGPWDLGGYIAITSSFMIYATVSMPYENSSFCKLSKVFYIISIIIGLYVLVLTQSRASWLLFSSYVLVFAFTSKGKILKILIPAALLLYFFASDEIISQVEEVVSKRTEYSISNSQTGGIDPSTLARVAIWKKILDNYDIAYLLTGYGIKNTYLTFGSTPHNTFLALFVHGGMISCVFIIGWIIRLFKYLQRFNSGVKKLVFALIIGSTMYGLTADLLYNAKVIVSMLLCFTIVFSFSNNRILGRNT